jgi:hypothetical protein
MTTTPKLGATELALAQAIPETTQNDTTRLLEQGAMLFAVKDKDLTAPPGSPADGDAYIVAASPTGAWTGKAKNVAFYQTGTGWRFVAPLEGMHADVADENALYRYDGAAWGTAAGGAVAWELLVAISDEATALTAGTAKITFRMPCAVTLSAVRASLSTAQTSGSTLTFDINKGGASILSTKLTIDNTEKTSATAATPAVISDTALADDAEIAIDIDTVGDGTAKGAKILLIGTRL